jgi:integrase/recombinase XerD
LRREEGVSVGEARLQVIAGGAIPQEPLTTDPWQFQTACVDAFVASWRARGFSPVTIDNDIGLLERTLKALGVPAWDVTPEDIDRVVGDLAVQGRKTSTRREYVQIFKGFHRFLQARKAAEIEAAFGVRLVCPIDEFNASRHVGDDSPALLPPPTSERVSEFFGFMKQRIATARKYGPAARDYAMFRTLYHAGLRSEEASLLEKPDLHFTRGPFGKLHVRFGKEAPVGHLVLHRPVGDLGELVADRGQPQHSAGGIDGGLGGLFGQATLAGQSQNAARSYGRR